VLIKGYVKINKGTIASIVRGVNIRRYRRRGTVKMSET
jgi:hypothetical protein